jgi:3-methyl-2-oxobutanoate hydroxymethyltransferase
MKNLPMSAAPLSSSTTSAKRRVHHFAMLRQRQQPIVMVTAHDYPSALIADQAGVDAILVGDSLGMTVLGFDSTIPVTLDMMIHHTAAVRRGTKRAFLVGDLPFMTYQISPAQAVESAGLLVQKGGAEAVKLEGGETMAPAVASIVNAGIPVMGHIGLLPQSVHRHGGYKVQGRLEDSARQLLADAKAIEAAGAFAIVLEAMDPGLAAQISESLTIPTIGIGAGRGCHGQILVYSDLLGTTPMPPPKFAKQYASIYDASVAALRSYAADVRNRAFPEQNHEY